MAKTLIIDGHNEEPCRYGGDIKEVKLIVTKETNRVTFQIGEELFQSPLSDLEELREFLK